MRSTVLVFTYADDTGYYNEEVVYHLSPVTVVRAAHGRARTERNVCNEDEECWLESDHGGPHRNGHIKVSSVGVIPLCTVSSV